MPSACPAEFQLQTQLQIAHFRRGELVSRQKCQALVETRLKKCVVAEKTRLKKCSARLLERLNHILEEEYSVIIDDNRRIFIGEYFVNLPD